MNALNKQTISAYDENVDEYIKKSPQTVDGDLKIWIDKVFSDIDKTSKIIEIGSGTGKDADYLENQGYTIERTDASHGFIEFQKNKGRKIKYLDIISDNFSDTYDVIFADAVFLHFGQKDLDFVLEKCKLALNNGGTIVFSLKQGEGDELTDVKLGSNRYFKYWDKNSISNLLKARNFSEIRIEEIEDYRKDRPGWLLITAKRVRI